jgi:hypothetical protein
MTCFHSGPIAGALGVFLIDVRIDRLWHKDCFGIWIFDRRGSETFVAKETRIDFEPAPISYTLPEPTLSIDNLYAQSLFQAMTNELIRHGLRADNDKTAGLLESQTKHLEDMRRLVFK